jgi:hypothetical protein
MNGTPHTIEIEINEDGEIASTVNGVQGPSCEELTHWLEDLGDTVEHRRTPDYYRQQRVGERVRVGNR